MKSPDYHLFGSELHILATVREWDTGTSLPNYKKVSIIYVRGKIYFYFVKYFNDGAASDCQIQ